MGDLTYETATHYIKCRHCLGRNCREYTMRCHVLGVTASGKVKIQVYGRLYWPGTRDKASIRYVDKSVLHKLPHGAGSHPAVTDLNAENNDEG